jgi:hypothetical protein
MKKRIILFGIGGTIYYLIEFIYKHFISQGNSNTHWAMFLLGGILFLLIGGLNEYFPWDLSIIVQGLIGTAAILVFEYLFGYILNI